MARPLRSKRLTMKTGENEMVVKINSKRNGTKKSDAIKEVMESEDQPNHAVKAESAVVERTSHSAKGNLYAGWATVNTMQSPVLRDRTNLPGEGFKVDVLIKKGADDDGGVKKTTKPTRNTTKSAKTVTIEEKEDENMEARNFVKAGKRKAQPKDQAEKVSSSAMIGNSENIKKTNILVKPETKQSVMASRKRITGRLASQQILSTKSNEIVESENKPLLQDIPRNEIVESESIQAEENTRVADKRVVKQLQTKKSLRPKKIDKPKGRSENEKEAKLEDIPEKKSMKYKTGTRTRASGNKVTKRFSAKTTMPHDESTENKEIEKNSHGRSTRTEIDEDVTSSDHMSAKNKFFGSKAAVGRNQRSSPVKKKVTAKRRNIGNSQKVRMSTSFRMRQMTLNESFANHTGRKFLRPRQAVKNYCEDTIIKEKRSSNDSNADIDPNKAADKKIGPIYKTVELLDDSVDDRNKIYEFQFDSNDSREKKRKKTRKRIVRKKVLTKKIKGTKSTKKIETSSEPTESTKTRANDATKKNIAIEKQNVVKQTVAEVNGPTRLPQVEFVASLSEAMETDEVPVVAKTDLVTPTVEKPAPRPIEKSVSKPTITESVELQGERRISLTSTPQLTKSSEGNSRLLDLKNGPRSSLQYKTMMNHALLNKSMSPITKAMENFDPGSPWRPPTFPTQQFFRVKNMVQSTPQLRNFAAILEKASLIKNKPGMMTNQTSTQNDKNESVPQSLNNGSPKQGMTLSKSPRKFGTEVSNINNPSGFAARIFKENNEPRQNITSPKKFGTETSNINNAPGITARVLKENNEPRQNITSPKKFGTETSNINNTPGITARVLKENNEPRQNITSPQKSAIESRVTNTSYNAISNSEGPSINSFTNIIDDKENCTPAARPSPRKSPYKTLRLSPYKSPKKLVSKLNPLRTSTNLSSTPKENIAPETGSSNAENLNIRDDSKILVQTNLNNFLNLEEMPKCTRIVTPHGIFDDAHSTPIPGKVMSRVKKMSSIDNAFGFDETDELAMSISPIKRPGVPIPDNPSGPMRLPIEGIRKHFLPILQKKQQAEARLVEKIGTEGNQVDHQDQKGKKKVSNKEKVVEPVDFIDTFDILEEQGKTDDNNDEKIVLFQDIEPVRFKQAPRYSYKRKHAGDLNFSEDEDEYNPSTAQHRETKKRKITKIEKERRKQMDNWAKDLNQTFEEIDHFDLVVE